MLLFVKRSHRMLPIVSRIFIVFLSCVFCWTTILYAIENDTDSNTEIKGDNAIDVANIDQEVLNKLSDDEKKWYIKFQKGLMFFDGWQEISLDILSVIPREEQSDTQYLLKTIGVKIGTEWCRENSIRRIDTDQLQSWGKRLRKAKKETPGTILDTLNLIEREVDALLVE